MNFKKVLACLLAACMAWSFTACKPSDEAAPDESTQSDRSESVTPDRVPDKVPDKVPDNAKHGVVGKPLKNAFFEYTLHSVEKVAEIDGEAPQTPDYAFLIVDVEVKNISSSVIPMFSTDFEVQWGSGENEWDFCYEKFRDDQMEDEYELSPGRTARGSLIYEVPASATDMGLRYLEVYEDDSLGDEFVIDFSTPAITASPNAGVATGATSSEVIGGKMKEAVVNEFFSFVVNEVSVAKEFDGNKASEGNQFVLVDVTVKNVFGEPIPMYNSDFTLDWGTGQNDFAMPLQQTADNQLADEFELAIDEEAQGIVVFEVSSSLTDANFTYVEIFADDSIGNTYQVPVTLR